MVQTVAKLEVPFQGPGALDHARMSKSNVCSNVESRYPTIKICLIIHVSSHSRSKCVVHQ